ncbi:HAD hydrolase-like protein, partial [Candidatus Woesearchaeota archaeon]|nr:HAD hydrolase-like protein [Candidatus Woesearchaeota archaeon]
GRGAQIRLTLDLEDARVFWDTFNQINTPEFMKGYTKPYEDSVVLRKLCRKYRTGIVTGALEELADMEIGLLEEFIGVPRDGLFGSVVFARPDRSIPPKPAPDGILKCLGSVGAEPKRAMYVGNADEDVLAAKNAGVLPVHVDRGDYEFEIKIPHAKIMTLHQLRSWIGL